MPWLWPTEPGAEVAVSLIELSLTQGLRLALLLQPPPLTSQ